MIFLSISIIHTSFNIKMLLNVIYFKCNKGQFANNIARTEARGDLKNKNIKSIYIILSSEINATLVGLVFL